MSRQFKVPVGLVQLSTDPVIATAGDIYFNSVSSKIKFYSGTQWLEVGAGSAGGGTTNHTHDYDGNVIVGAGGSLVTTATFAAGVPNNLNGGEGDVYIDITNLNVYVKNSGTWGSPTAINAYTVQEVDNLLAGKAATGHTHTLSDITGITVTAQEVNYLSGLTDNIQDQLDNVGNSLGDYIPLSQLGVAGGVPQINPDSQIVTLSGGIKFSDNTVQTTAFNTSGFATVSQLSDVEVLALAGL